METSKLKGKEELQEYVVSHIDEAIEKGWIKAYYQPVVRTLTGQLCGMEALARWDDPEYGFLNPGEFISALEESSQIHKLDCHMVRIVCKDLREKLDHGRKTVPVSFNLSRLDFSTCDIFKIVEDTLIEFRVPRDLVNIEITESIMDSSLFIREQVKIFSASGYQVWMDDFGSGYSSLNVLKDYEFDELKIDMLFLSELTERSKRIIRAVVGMAKDIGIQTVAEGVETEEQFQFLKNIGCEKVQGFLFGRPMPLEDLERNTQVQGLLVETRQWKRYFSTIAGQNLLTEKALALIEDDGEALRYIFANDQYRHNLADLGSGTLEIAERNLNDTTSPMHKLYRSFAEKTAESGGRKDFFYVDRGNNVRLELCLIACQDRYRTFRVSIEIIPVSQEDLRMQEVDTYMHNMSLLYSSMVMLHLDEDYAETVMEDGVFVAEKIQREDLKGLRNRFANMNVYRDDIASYLRFADSDDMAERVKMSKNGVLNGRFRIRDKQTGEYNWKLFTIMHLPNEKKEVYMQLVKDSATELYPSEEVITYDGSMTDISQINFGKESLTYKQMWETLMYNVTDRKFFWKDKDRRFVGVSRAFMEYYGIVSPSQIIGLTYDDLKWNVSTGDFAEDEMVVLQEGRTIREQPGKALIHGTMHNILVNKTPIYKNGKIIGLLGYFIDADEVPRSEQYARHASIMDPLTGIMSAYGVLNTLWQYQETLENRDEDYTLTAINIPQYHRICKTFGKEIGDSLVRQAAGKLLEVYEQGAAIGRVYSATFAMLRKAGSADEEQANVQQMERALREAIASIHQVDGRDCTVSAQVATTFGSENTSLNEAIFRVMSNMDIKSEN